MTEWAQHTPHVSEAVAQGGGGQHHPRRASGTKRDTMLTGTPTRAHAAGSGPLHVTAHDGNTARAGN